MCQNSDIVRCMNNRDESSLTIVKLIAKDVRCHQKDEDIYMIIVKIRMEKEERSLSSNEMIDISLWKEL